ncbi:MAG: tetratricopeptide repeat protein [Gemmatimonadota bacterium]|nr:tetratricopeptide repeat protein [Gemmatimonadota bacterium]
MSPLRRLIHEVHRRSLWQVLGIYLAGSWVALQVVEQLVAAAGLPVWVQPLSLALLVVGVPIVMATAFVQEGGPGDSAGGAREAAPDVGAGATAVAEQTAGKRLFTWRNAIVGGITAFALLGIAAAAYLVMRSAGIGPAGTLVAKGVVEDRSRVVLADFASEDPSLGRAATEAFRIDLTQSRVVRVTEQTMIAETLRRMDRDPEAGLDLAIAREAARREGIPLVLTGEITRAGGGYLLTADLIEASSGEVLANDRQVAADSTEILPAIDDLSRSLRERIGDSLRDLARDPPLERVTTSDLQALEFYSRAVQAADVEGNAASAVELLEAAIERDSAFAMAHRKLGVVISNLGFDRARSRAALEAAYRFRDRLTEGERHMTEGSYHTSVTLDAARAITAYETLLARAPEHHSALNNLAVLLLQRDDLEALDTVEALLSRAIAADSSLAHPWDNLVDLQVRAGKLDEATATLNAAVGALPQNISLAFKEVEFAAMRRDWTTAEDLSRTLPERFRGNPEAAGADDFNLAVLASVRGRLGDAGERLVRSAEASERMGRELWAIQDLIDRAAIDIVLGGRPDRGVAEMEAVLRERSFDTLPAVNRPDVDVARFFALAGRVDRARAALESAAARPSAAEGSYDDYQMRFARSEIAIAEGDGAAAVQALEGVEPDGCTSCLVQLGRAYDAAGRPDSAILAYERYVDVSDIDRVYVDRWWLGRSLERLARLHDQAGNLDQAELYYAMFVELWREADDLLQPLVRAADDRLQEILAIRG